MLHNTIGLHRLALIGVRVLWIVLASMILLYLSAGLPRLFSYYEFPCETDSSPICTTAIQTGLGSFDLSRSFVAWYNVIWMVAICVPIFILCSLLAWRKNDDLKTLLFSIAFMMAIVMNADYTLTGVVMESYPAAKVAVIMLVYGGQLSGTMFYVFPDGRFVPRWTRWMAAVLAVLSLVAVLIHWWPLSFTGWPGKLFDSTLWVVFALTAAYALVYRFRKTANLEQRQQIKGLVWAIVLGSLLFTADIVISLVSDWFGGDISFGGDVSGATQHVIYQTLVSPSFGYVGLLLSCLGFYIAIFQFRLWDVDFLINRSLVYGGLTVLLGVVLVGVFVATQALLGAMVTGMQAGAAGIVSAIVVITLFAPVRDRLQHFVDSRFYGVDPSHERAVQAAIAQERDRLSQELHDSVTQSLYGLAIMAESCQRLARDEKAKQPLIEMGEVARQALKEMRLLIYELRPPVLEEEGLLCALHQRLAAVEKRSGMEASLVIGEVVDLPVVIEEALYYIAIEALNNAIKHAAATSVGLSLRMGDRWVEMEIVDDGQGFDPGSDGRKGGMGLAGMRKRAKELGGTLTVHSMPGQGTIVTARIAYHTDSGKYGAESVL